MSELMEIVDDTREFFAPVSSDVIDGLLAQYQQQRSYIDHIAGIASGDMGNAINWFIDGNRDRASHMPAVERLFAPAGAIASLNSRYWSDTLALTDVYSAMPQARRDEWNKSISDKATPEYTEDTVRSSLNGWLADRSKFFAERVDGIFRNLSGDHVTNCPQGFSKRMILAYVTENGYHSTSRAGLINDLRAVIAKFMGRDEPAWNATNVIVSMARKQSGQWLTLDGGALRIRCYKIGTAHLEVHPDMAYRLNQVLAGMYPRAIPAEFRTKPKKKAKEFQMMGRPLPFAVLDIIREMRRERGTNNYMFGYGTKESLVAKEEALRVVIGIGGVLSKCGGIDFEYDPQEAMNEIIASGCIPDRVAHQYFPTPELVARAAVEMADIGPADIVLEPSAGQGGIADFLPMARTRCIEISELHCKILAAKGFDVARADFIDWAAKTADRFDRIVMNPPFSDGRALTHLLAAAELVASGGRIVAVLPASLNGKDVLPGWCVTWSEVFEGEFAGTSVSVVILAGVRV
ncbi:DUF4942 domain-containing protein [Undibacterium arcticum]|uniref:DUF4942 domain-containing protein n=1 Tax=Undibacterium arcticum TaxID=1762892 RepID=A0ABV7EX77_9BURK